MEKNKKVVLGLKKVLGTTFVLYLQAHNFHWNVVGPKFYGYHMMYEGMYNELFGVIDDLAERIRQLGEFAPGTFAKFEEFSLAKPVEEIPTAFEMLEITIENYKEIISLLAKTIDAADEAKDSVTIDLLSSFKGSCEKTLWMLNANLES
ncbi:MAG: DNA starvation/stationary phase protection protein [Psittacicella sp.]